MDRYRLISAKGSGGAIVELLLSKAQLPFEVDRIEWSELTSDENRKINPLAQTPSLILPSGEVMTESLAMCTYLNQVGKLNLVPPPESSEYPKYLRWSVFLVASIYPTFTYSDNPKKWVTDEASSKELRTKIDDFRLVQWAAFEKAASTPHFLERGESLIDYYLACMVFWRPGVQWFEANCPKILKCAKKIHDTDLFKSVYAANS